ncbi:hypothetical protein [uncultured Photobacterium sp.]|uniref:hypothetical protein n=1 Tax=uncultured Photobacterium sp. TaxID=173973 RepID=UPI0026032B84|nr:hypothetical protein [uncultured Photobacterium sp.]
MAVIEAKCKHFRIDYSKKVLPALFKKQDSDCDFSEGLLRIDSERVKEEINKSALTLVIATDQIRDQKLIQALQVKADSGVRIYLLLGDKNVNQMAIDALSGRCLVRTGVSQKGALILRDHSTNNAQGVLVMNHQLFTVVGEQSWAIQLESQQIDDSFRSFCKLFWEYSQDEYLLQNQPEKKATHPNGNIITNHSHQLCGTLKECLNETFASIQGVSHTNFGTKGNTYLLLLKVNSPDVQARHGVALSDTSIPSLLISEQGNWLLPDSTDFNATNWCLRLSDQQSQQLVTTYENALEEAAWQYKSKVMLEEFGDKQTLRFADQSDLVRQVEQQRNKELEPISTQSIDSFLNDEPEILAQSQIGWQRDFLAHQIDYKVMVHPPYCPQEAKTDGLYADWDKAEQDWQERLSALEHQQQLIDKQQANIADKLKGFLQGFLLGQGQSVKKQNQELLELKQWSATQATPAEREQHSKRFETLLESVQVRGQSTATEMDKAKQNQQWEEKQQQLEKQRDNAKSVANAKKIELESLALGKPQSQSEAEKTFIHRWKKAVESLSEEQLKNLKVHDIELKLFLPKDMPEDKEAKQAASHQASADFTAAIKSAFLAMDCEAAGEWRHSIKEKVFKKHYVAMNRAFNDHQQALQKIERDLKAANDDVDKARRALASAEQALTNHGLRFEYKPNNGTREFGQQLGLKSSGNTKSRFDWPMEDLPIEGAELKADGKQRWLVINDTDQLEQARKDAERLNAVICVNDPA